MKSRITSCFYALSNVLYILPVLAREPNIIFVLADDLGWAELGCYGNAFNETPNLDKVAQEGVLFNQAYAAAPVCSPYRAAFLTGQHPARLNILDYLRPNSANALPAGELALPEILRSNGYRTGMVGKWHLTGYKLHGAEFEVRPADHGFDFNIGSEVKGVGNGANFYPYVFRTQPVPWVDLSENRLGEGEYLTDRLNLEAVEFIGRKKASPFFLYLSHFAPHTILNGRPDLVEKYRKKYKPGPSTRDRCYLCQDNGLTGDAGNHWAQHHNPHLAAMLECIDEGIGLIDHKLKELGLFDDTILIFSSDNGGETNVSSNAPLRGGKSQLYEGGIRVPFLVRWPNGKVPAGKVCQHLTSNQDIYPTLLEAAGIQPEPSHFLDGQSILDSFRNPESDTCGRILHWHYPLDSPHFLGGVSAGAIRKGDWKLVEFFNPGTTSPYELYNLKDDPSEKENLSAIHPGIVQQLQTLLAGWRVDTGARLPSPPLLAEPSGLLFGEHFSDGQISPRWWVEKEWETGGGILRRNKLPGENKRVFYKEPRFKDALVRFDFRFDGATDLRLVTGSSGHYNAVVHIHPGHFFIQTAFDDRGPWYPMTHGECAYEFLPGQWYTMTVEFLGDELVAHIDSEHLAYAKHPILGQERTYFAVQVNRPSAAFDNIQAFNVRKHKDYSENLSRLLAHSGKFPVRKDPEEEYETLKRDTHASLHLNDPDYRQLVNDVEQLDQEKQREFPDAFLPMKYLKKKVQEKRKQALLEDPAYKDALFATHRANRALEQYLHGQDPTIGQLPASRQKAALERARLKHLQSPSYQGLLHAAKSAQENLETSYPGLFPSDQDLLQTRKAAMEKLKDDPRFKTLQKARSQAYFAQQDYLHESNPWLASLRKQLGK
jgi:arylsulfatase A